MAVTERTVKQAQQRGRTHRKGRHCVYDVNVKYKSGGKSKDPIFPQGLPDKEGRFTA